jgi:hypothetical protein
MKLKQILTNSEISEIRNILLSNLKVSPYSYAMSQQHNIIKVYLNNLDRLNSLQQLWQLQELIGECEVKRKLIRYLKKYNNMGVFPFRV